MDVKQFLLTTAVKRGWMNPHADSAVFYQPSRVNPITGTRGTIANEYFEIVLPDSQNKWVVFQLGMIPPRYSGIQGWLSSWLTAETVANREEMILQFYINYRQLPLDAIKIKYSENNNFLIAIDAVRCKDLLKTKFALQMRVYSSSWFALDDADAYGKLTTQSVYVNNNTEISTLLSGYNLKKALKGNVYLWHNGFYVDKLPVAEVKVGDSLIFTYDPSGAGYYDIKLSKLKYFTSEIDAKRKYIVSAPDNDRNHKVDYMDDIDIYVCCPELDITGTTRTVGVYYSINTYSDLRMLTKRDYAIDAERVSQIIYQQNPRIDFTTAFIRVFVRDSGVDKIPPKDGNLLDDLYLVDHATRDKIFSGTLSAIDRWYAPTLEKSGFSLWMGLDGHELGYDKLAGVISWQGLYDLTQKMEHTAGKFNMPIMMHNGGIIYYFYTDGTLHSFYEVTPSVGKQAKITAPVGVTKAFCIPGYRAYLSGDVESNSRITSDPYGDYEESRYYKIGTTAWQLAKEDVDYFTNDDYSITWSSNHTSSSRIKRSSGTYYIRTFTTTPAKLVDENTIYADGSMPSSGLPMGRLQLWIKGNNSTTGWKALAEDIDFKVIDNQKFRIYNASYFTSADTSIEVHVLHWGLPQYTDESKFGFVQHRMVNYDVNFDLAPYRNKDLYIDGKRYEVEEIDFSEIRSGNMPASVREGAIYTLQNSIGSAPVIKLDGLVEDRDTSLIEEKIIGDFLTELSPEVQIDEPVILTTKHKVVSVLLHTLIEKIIGNVLVISNANMSVVAVDLALRDYRGLIELDVCRLDTDWDFIQVQATARKNMVTVSSKEYSFLKQVNDLYLSSRVVLNNYLVIG